MASTGGGEGKDSIAEIISVKDDYLLIIEELFVKLKFGQK